MLSQVRTVGLGCHVPCLSPIQSHLYMTGVHLCRVFVSLCLRFCVLVPDVLHHRDSECFCLSFEKFCLTGRSFIYLFFQFSTRSWSPVAAPVSVLEGQSGYAPLSHMDVLLVWCASSYSLRAWAYEISFSTLSLHISRSLPQIGHSLDLQVCPVAPQLTHLGVHGPSCLALLQVRQVASSALHLISACPNLPHLWQIRGFGDVRPHMVSDVVKVETVWACGFVECDQNGWGVFLLSIHQTGETFGSHYTKICQPLNNLVSDRSTRSKAWIVPSACVSLPSFSTVHSSAPKLCAFMSFSVCVTLFVLTSRLPSFWKLAFDSFSRLPSIPLTLCCTHGHPRLFNDFPDFSLIIKYTPSSSFSQKLHWSSARILFTARLGAMFYMLTWQPRGSLRRRVTGKENPLRQTSFQMIFYYLIKDKSNIKLTKNILCENHSSPSSSLLRNTSTCHHVRREAPDTQVHDQELDPKPECTIKNLIKQLTRDQEVNFLLSQKLFPIKYLIVVIVIVWMYPIVYYLLPHLKCSLECFPALENIQNYLDCSRSAIYPDIRSCIYAQIWA